MAKKKRRRRKDRIRLSLVFPAGVLLVLIGCAVALFGVHSKKASSPVTTTPAYEEIHLAAVPRTPHEIERINRVLYESLYHNGIPEKDVCFRSVRPNPEKDPGWEFTELLVTCRDRERIDRVADTMERALSALDSATEFRMTERGESGRVYRIGIGGVPTHLMVFSPEPCLPLGERRPRVAIIIDDLGYDRAIASSFMKLNMELTLSILPHAPFTRSVAREAAKRGFETLLHLPLEPKGYPSVHPGPGALLVEMNDSDIVAALSSNLDQIPGIQGVNNHMGSEFTENREKMALVLRELKRKNLFYVDSRTSGRTVGYALAQEMGIPCASRNVFLDNDLDPQAIRIQLERLKGLARHSGGAIGIAHPYRETLGVLKERAFALASELDMVPVSELVSTR